MHSLQSDEDFDIDFNRNGSRLNIISRECLRLNLKTKCKAKTDCDSGKRLNTCIGPPLFSGTLKHMLKSFPDIDALLNQGHGDCGMVVHYVYFLIKPK